MGLKQTEIAHAIQTSKTSFLILLGENLMFHTFRNAFRKNGAISGMLKELLL